MLPANEPGRSLVLVTDDAGGTLAGRAGTVPRRRGRAGSGNPPWRGEGGRGQGGPAQGGSATEQVEIPVLVEAKYADFVRQGSAFWRAGGLSVSMSRRVSTWISRRCSR